jgi:hypothetical protein
MERRWSVLDELDPSEHPTAANLADHVVSGGVLRRPRSDHVFADPSRSTPSSRIASIVATTLAVASG